MHTRICVRGTDLSMSNDTVTLKLKQLKDDQFAKSATVQSSYFFIVWILLLIVSLSPLPFQFFH